MDSGLQIGDSTLSVVMEDIQVDEIARRSMESEKKVEGKNPWTAAFETASTLLVSDSLVLWIKCSPCSFTRSGH